MIYLYLGTWGIYLTRVGSTFGGESLFGEEFHSFRQKSITRVK
jgi:hypothetical protein